MALAPKSNLTEKDPFQLFRINCLNFLKKHKNYFIFSFIAILLIVAGSVFYIKRQENSLRIARKNLIEANDKKEKKKYVESEKLYLNIINSNYDKRITLRSKLALSNLYKIQKKYTKSLSLLKSTLQDKGIVLIEKELINRSLVSVYSKKTDCNEISDILDKNEFTILKKDDLYLELGRCYVKKGDNKKSLEVYKRLLVKYPKSPFITSRIKILQSSE